MQPFNLNILEEALTILGEALKERKQRVSLAVIGGSVLLLQDYITRPTRDIDVVALLDEDGKYKSATPLPDFLIECKNEVADFLGLDHHWLNGGPTLLLKQGLPENFEKRVSIRKYGNLTLCLASRIDLLFLKFYAAVDCGPDSKHVQDLKALKPTEPELLAAAKWAQSHDPSDGFHQMTMETLEFFGVTDVNSII